MDGLRQGTLRTPQSVEHGLLNRDLPEPHYRVVSQGGGVSRRKWRSRMYVHDWVLWWNHAGRFNRGTFPAAPVVAILRVIPKPVPFERQPL